MVKSLANAIFGMCLNGELNDQTLVLLCDCVDEMEKTTIDCVKECENVKRMMIVLNEKLTGSLNLQTMSHILHLLNEMNSVSDSNLTICKRFIEKQLKENEAEKSHSLLSMKQWSDEETVCLSECIRSVMNGESSIEWVLHIIESVYFQPVMMKQIASKPNQSE